jgi:hypothetical protein
MDPITVAKPLRVGGPSAMPAASITGCDKQRNDYAKLRIIVRMIAKHLFQMARWRPSLGLVK